MRHDVPTGYVVLAVQGVTKLLGRIEQVLAYGDGSHTWLVSLSTEADIAFGMKSARAHAEVWIKCNGNEWVLA